MKQNYLKMNKIHILLPCYWLFNSNKTSFHCYNVTKAQITSTFYSNKLLDVTNVITETIIKLIEIPPLAITKFQNITVLIQR